MTVAVLHSSAVCFHEVLQALDFVFLFTAARLRLRVALQIRSPSNWVSLLNLRRRSVRVCVERELALFIVQYLSGTHTHSSESEAVWRLWEGAWVMYLLFISSCHLCRVRDEWWGLSVLDEGCGGLGWNPQWVVFFSLARQPRMKVSIFAIHYENTNPSSSYTGKFIIWVFSYISLENLSGCVRVNADHRCTTLLRSLQRFLIRFKSWLGYARTLAEATSALCWLWVLSHCHARRWTFTLMWGLNPDP